MPTSARERFLVLLRAAVRDGALVKLTLGKHRSADPTLQNLFVRPVILKGVAQLSFVWRHATRDLTKNFPPAEALALLEPLVGGDFLDAHLFTPTQIAQLETQPDGAGRLKIKIVARPAPVPPATHDRAKEHRIPADAAWLRALGVTNDQGRPREGMADKFRQIQKFTELLTHLLAEADLLVAPATSSEPAPSPTAGTEPPAPLRVADMGCGKGYLTFATAALLGERAHVQGIEARAELVALCNATAHANHFPNLSFTAGTIADAPLEKLDVLIALHACDTATDDALARGIAAGARLLVVSPCCQKELRPQLTAPPVLADALRHGIFQERQAEFVTDALRAQLLEWAGYRVKVFEFIATEHTAKNLMIAAIRSHPPGDVARTERVQSFADFYGIKQQRLAAQLGFTFTI